MALTLLEASKLNDGDVHRQAIIEMFAANSDILRVLPFEDVPGGSLSYNQEGILPGVGFRAFNAAYSESVGTLNPQVEFLRIAGGDLDTDKALLKTRGQDQRSVQEAMKVKALSLYLTGQVINGDSDATSGVSFDGIRKRIVGYQLITANIQTTGSAQPLSLAALDTAIDRVDNPTHLIMSKAMRQLLTSASRNYQVGGFIDYAQDEFGHRVTLYNGLPILIADYDNTGAKIIDFNEVGVSGSTNQSLYCVSIGTGMLTGLQNGVMEVTDLGELQTKPVFRTRIEWLVGLAAMHGRCASRIWSITNAAVTA
jgi:hypothetical protein